jgi:hypothetical protein
MIVRRARMCSASAGRMTDMGEFGEDVPCPMTMNLQDASLTVSRAVGFGLERSGPSYPVSASMPNTMQLACKPEFACRTQTISQTRVTPALPQTNPQSMLTVQRIVSEVREFASASLALMPCPSPNGCFPVGFRVRGKEGARNS